MTNVFVLAGGEVSPDSVRALAQGGPVTVWYAADVYEPLSRLIDARDPEIRIAPMSARLNALMTAHRQALIDIGERVLGDAEPGSLAWTSSNMADRGPYLTPFIRNVLRRMVIAEGLAEPGPHVVIADDLATARALIGQAPDLAEKMRCLWGALRARAAGVKFFHRWKAAANRQGALTASFTGVDTALIVWGNDQTFRADAGDTVLGPLPGIVERAGRRIGFVVNPQTWVADLAALGARMDALPTPSVLIGSLMSWRDFLAALPGSIGLPFAARARVDIGGIDIGAVARLHAWRDAASFAPVYARLFRHVIGRLKAAVPTLRRVGYIYENQPWEKCLLAGGKGLGIELIGIQHSPFAPDYLLFFPDSLARVVGYVPDRLCVTGDLYKRGFTDAGLNVAALETIGALRHDIRRASAERGAGTADGRPFCVLCALSIQVDEAMDLVHKVLTAAVRLSGISVVVSMHYAMDPADKQRVRDLIARFDVPVEIGEQGSDAFMHRVDLVAYNTTGAVFSFLAAGAPLLFVGRHATPDNDKVASGLRLEARDADDIAATIAAVLGGTAPAASRGDVDAYLADSLAPVDAAKIEAVFSGQKPLKRI